MARARDPAGLVTVRLVFVYAGDGGAISGLVHYVHKLVSPATYPCHLCALTDGWLGRRAAWSRALAGLRVDYEFLHRDELEARHGRDHGPLPAVFVARGGLLEVLIGKPEIDACTDLDALIDLLRARTAELRDAQHA